MDKSGTHQPNTVNANEDEAYPATPNPCRGRPRQPAPRRSGDVSTGDVPFPGRPRPPPPLQSPRPLLYSYDAPTPLPLDSRTTTTAHPFRGAVPLALIFFFFVGFFSVYLLRDLVEHLASAWHARRGGNTPGPGGAAGGSGGLDPAALDAFPVCRYSSVKEGKCGAECAVCLSEFSGDDAVRVLTACRHAFHRGCIDPWLASHATCPVCRSDLGKPPEKAAAGPEEEGRGSAVGAGTAAQNFELIQMGIP